MPTIVAFGETPACLVVPVLHLSIHISSLSELLDQFLTESLRVNESACSESPRPPT